MRLGIVTCAKCRELTASERPLLSLLQPYGIEASPVVWNDPGVDWASFTGLLVRSVWDYHLYPKDFNVWLEHQDQLQMRVWNPTSVLRWNSHKFYLRDLSERGVEVVPSLYLEKGYSGGKQQALDCGWSDVVIKPAISASGYRTHAMALLDPEIDSVFSEASSHGDFLVQPFLPAIRETGEVSLVFFDRVYSHAVLKRPRNDDFRVQVEHGGTESAYVPDPSVILTAEEILRKTGMELLYARVDGVLEGGRFVLMELELIEPDLFLSRSPDATNVFASRIAGRLRPSASS